MGEMDHQKDLGGVLIILTFKITLAGTLLAIFLIDDLLFRIIYGIFGFGFLIVGILLVIGSYFENRLISNIGYLFGLISLTIMIIITGYCINWYKETIISLNIISIFGLFFPPIYPVTYYLFFLMPLTEQYTQGMQGLGFSDFIAIIEFIATIYVFFQRRAGYDINYRDSRFNEYDPSLAPLHSHNKNVMPKVIISDDFNTHSKKIICPICKTENSDISILCKSCRNLLPRCKICKKPISSEKIVYCPICKASYHRSEFFEWIKIKGFCKICKHKINSYDIKNILEEIEESPVNDLILCPKCRKRIPEDANFCIYCGIQIILA